ncbi:DinB family protein [Egicoccus sp. AB-alg6-2]|uniref:DinB family protein n=1 Tax=Egicoccus sp. AB-alg6-2 TaxID=3242692 RepID=UPI00359E93F1
MDTPARLAPLLAQFDTSIEALRERLTGVDDHEWRWEPGPRAWTVRPIDGGWRRDREDERDPVGTVRTLAWLGGHLAEMGLLRSDYTDGDHDLTPQGLCTQWPGTAAEGVAFLFDGLGRWRATLGRMDDEDLDTVGRSQMPWGLDPNLPLLDIVWWVNRELIHHAAEMAFIRDLYAQVGNPREEAA